MEAEFKFLILVSVFWNHIDNCDIIHLKIDFKTFRDVLREECVTILVVTEVTDYIYVYIIHLGKLKLQILEFEIVI